jgi:hypothetical protein
MPTAENRRPKAQGSADRPLTRVAELARHFKIVAKREEWVFTCRQCERLGKEAAWEVRRDTDANGRAAPDISKGAYGSLLEHALKATAQHRDARAGSKGV